MAHGPDDPAGPARGEVPDLVDALRRLALLRDRDVLTEDEYRLAKAKLVRAHQGDQGGAHDLPVR